MRTTALFRAKLEDFQVDEVLDFPFSGEGEHLCLQIEKRGENTRWVAKLLAELFEVDEVAIGYCGLKDRRAVTRQWFSIHLPNTLEVTGPDPTNIDVPEFKVLTSCRHNKKLRRGMHKANRFVIRLREIQGSKEALEIRLQQILQRGVPNYFGEQRFGIDGGNLLEADRLLRREYGADRKKGRRKRGSPRGGIYLSAARSYLFNLVLAERIRQGSWRSLMEGEGFCSDEMVSPPTAQVAEAHTTGPMWGRGRSSESESVRELEQSVLSEWQEWTNALEFSGLQQERRPLVLCPEELNWQWFPTDNSVEENNDLELSFALSSGSFATSVLRELLTLSVPASVIAPVSASSGVI